MIIIVELNLLSGTYRLYREKDSGDPPVFTGVRSTVTFI